MNAMPLTLCSFKICYMKIMNTITQTKYITKIIVQIEKLKNENIQK